MSKHITLETASVKQLEQELKVRKLAKIVNKLGKIKGLEEEKNILKQELSGIIKNTINTTLQARTKNTKTVKKSMYRSRAINTISLKDQLISIASDGKVRTAKEFLNELQGRGWQTNSTNPYYVVAAALCSQQKKNIFRRINKGSYELIKQ